MGIYLHTTGAIIDINSPSFYEKHSYFIINIDKIFNQQVKPEKYLFPDVK